MTRHCPNEDCPGLARDGIVAEYVDTMEACVDCGARLIPGEALPEPPPPLEYNELRTVFIAADVLQGHLARAVLEAEGIPVFLKGEGLRSAVGELPPDVMQVEVQVPFEREEEGRALVARFEPGERGRGRGSARSAGIDAGIDAGVERSGAGWGGDPGERGDDPS